MPDFTAAAEGPPPASQPPDHVPPIVVFLASDAGARISGKVFEAVANQVGVYRRPEVLRRVFKSATMGPWPQDELAQAIPGLLGGDLHRAAHLGLTVDRAPAPKIDLAEMVAERDQRQVVEPSAASVKG